MQTQMMLFIWVIMIIRVCVQRSAASLDEIERNVDVEERELDDLFQRKEAQISAPVTLGRAVNAPGNLMSYQDKIGQTFLFTVYGSLAEGPLHGSHIYTLDIYPARAAIHVGLARPVTILPDRGPYMQCTLNGVHSSSALHTPGSFRFTDDDGVGCNSGSALPAPPNLTTYRGKNGQTFVFTVTGALGGSVWGTHTYKDDSSLATAAVHAGVVRVGETKNVRVTIRPGQSSYQSCTLNGIKSSPYGAFTGSYEFPADAGQRCDSGSESGSSSSAGTAIPAPGRLTGYRGKNGQTFLFTITGAAGGPIWGTHVYTDDSSLARAAVHAGLVKVGETKNIHVTILPGQSSYLSCTLHGITSTNYGRYAGSFRFTDDVSEGCSSSSSSGGSGSGSGSGSGAGGWHAHSFTSTWISSGPGWISTYFTTYTVFSTVDGGDDIQWESSYEDSDTEIGNSESYTAGYPFGGGRVVTYYSTVTNTEYNSAWDSSGNF